VWEIEGTDEFADWFSGLAAGDRASVIAAVDVLERYGPALGRPFVDTIHSSRHAHMKELRPRGGHLRVLFAFDPRRSAILLLGGDKRNRWDSWYPEAIQAADSLYDEHLATLKREGLIP
jgi:hypothetical protein